MCVGEVSIWNHFNSMEPALILDYPASRIFQFGSQLIKRCFLTLNNQRNCNHYSFPSLRLIEMLFHVFNFDSFELNMLEHELALLLLSKQGPIWRKHTCLLEEGVDLCSPVGVTRSFLSQTISRERLAWEKRKQCPWFAPVVMGNFENELQAFSWNSCFHIFSFTEFSLLTPTWQNHLCPKVLLFLIFGIIKEQPVN